MRVWLKLSGATILATTAAFPAGAEQFQLDTIVVVDGASHPSQQVRAQVEGAAQQSRTTSTVDGSVVQNVSPVNKLDAVRYNTTGILNQPGTGDRFGASTKIRTFGDWGAAESIDGLPAIKSAGEEGGGYSNTMIPSIAVDRISVLKGGRAVGYGDGTDGGVLETRIKSGRAYTDHGAVSLDASSAGEALVQAEAADHGEQWDYYAALNGFAGDYDREPPNLESQTTYGGLGKVGLNLSEDTRIELLTIYDRSEPEIYRNAVQEDVSTEQSYSAVTVDHRLSETTSLRAGALYNDSRSLWEARSRDRSVDTAVAFADAYTSVALSDDIHFDGSLGGEYRHTEYLRDNQWENTFADVAAIARGALTFDDNLTLSAGLRNTWLTNDIVLNGVTQPDNLESDTVFSYELGAAYSVLENTRLRASWATGYNRFYEKYGNFGSDPLDTTNGAGDAVVESRTAEIGVRQTFDRGYVDLALYNIVQDNVPRRNNGAIESVEVDQSGLELEMLWQLTDAVALSGGYMYVIDLEATRADGTSANSNIFFGTNGTSVPKHQLNGRATWAVTDDLSLWTAAFWSSGYEAVNFDGSVTERDGYSRFDLGAAYAVADNVVLRGRVENLTDEKDFGTTVKGVAANDGGNIGRVFWLGADVVF
ncbi:TonB-dependent receptor [Caenispirillum bisanense]|uniref:TonB-dependent Receptor Plug Domain n=1 Tax=Caenispirillum bisanense TaxID=414052 RepID=A0A286G5F8_9PROT|nr:TonB-dependent Receptor Plug Domain [Caenispirillum bisanense]